MLKLALPDVVPEPSCAPPRLGAFVLDKGVYMGVWEQEQMPGRRFVVYAALEDLTDSNGKKILLQYNEAVEEIAKRRNWYGHDGVRLESDAAVYEALINGSHGGRWFIPPRELVDGKNADGDLVYPHNLYQLRDRNTFKGTFDTSDSTYSSWYWSSSERRNESDGVWCVCFSDGDDNWYYEDNFRLAVRPVRVEELVI